MRAALQPEEARVMELYYDVEPTAKCITIPQKMSYGLRASPAEIAAQLDLQESTVANHHRQIKSKNAGRPVCRALLRMSTKPCMFPGTPCSCLAYLDAARVLDGVIAKNARSFALKTLDRCLLKSGAKPVALVIASAVRRWMARSTIKFSAF